MGIFNKVQQDLEYVVLNRMTYKKMLDVVVLIESVKCGRSVIGEHKGIRIGRQCFHHSGRLPEHGSARFNNLTDAQRFMDHVK